MLSPTGPLPPQVYWRRRALAVAVVVLVLVLVVWIVSALVGGSAPQPAAQQSPLAPSTSTATTPPATPVAGGATTGPSSTPAAATTTPLAAAVVPTTAPAAPTAPPPSAAPPASTTAAPPPPACIDPSIAVVAQVAQPSYPVGQQPVFRILIANAGKTPCVRDLNAALQSVTVFTADGSTRLWSSNDCYPGKSTDVPTLTPGKVKTFSVKWSGTTSEPTCTADRTRVPPGQYRVVATLGKLASAPVPFTLV